MVPRSPQDIIGSKDGCDEWNSAKAMMGTEKSKYRIMVRPGQVRTGQSDFAGCEDGSKTGHGCFLVGRRIDGDTDTSEDGLSQSGSHALYCKPFTEMRGSREDAAPFRWSRR